MASGSTTPTSAGSYSEADLVEKLALAADTADSFKESLAKSEMLAVGFGQHTRSFQSRLYVSNEKYEMKTAPPLRTRPVVEFTPKPPIPTERPELDAWLASFGAAPRPPPWHAPSPPSRPASARVRPTTPRAVNARPSSASPGVHVLSPPQPAPVTAWLKPASTLSRPASARTRPPSAGLKRDEERLRGSPVRPASARARG